MKKFGLAILLLIGGSYGAAWYMPGFWGHIPQDLRDKVPAGWRAAINMPAPAVAAKPAEPPRAAGGGGRGGAGGGRPTPVTVATVEKKSMPVRVETVGTVQTISTVTVRSRVDSQIDEIRFVDGAMVKAGDVLAKLDSRAIEAQIRQVEATIARDKASLDLAQRTLKRGEDLANANIATMQRIDENRGAVAVQQATLKSNEAAAENLRAQLTYYTIRAPISGKAGLANLKPGNIARSSDAATPITTINQVTPIYVAFSLPQRNFQDLRESIERGDSIVEATPQGSTKAVKGKLTLVENTMDNATGTIGVRATFDNPNEILWPGGIVGVKVTLRTEANAVTVPRAAVQMSQRGNFVFLVVDGAAKMQPVTVGRGVDGDTTITSGLTGGETVIVDGQLLVVDGARVQPRVAGGPAAATGEPGQRPGGGGQGRRPAPAPGAG